MNLIRAGCSTADDVSDVLHTRSVPPPVLKHEPPAVGMLNAFCVLQHKVVRNQNCFQHVETTVEQHGSEHIERFIRKATDRTELP